MVGAHAAAPHVIRRGLPGGCFFPRPRGGQLATLVAAGRRQPRVAARGAQSAAHLVQQGAGRWRRIRTT